MGSRSSNLRRKVVALLASLVALWAFAAWVTLREGANLLWVQQLDSEVAQPGEPLVLELQAERRATVAFLGGSGGDGREQLTAQWSHTQQVADAFRDSVDDWRVDLAASDDSRRQINGVVAGLDRLEAVRESVDARQVDRATAAQAYTDLINSMLQMYSSLGNLDDEQLARETSALIQLVRVRELMSQEDALLTGVLAAGRMTPEENAAFARTVGAQRYLGDRALADLSAADRRGYEQLLAGEPFVALRALEDRLILSTRATTAPQVSAKQWRAAVDRVVEEQQRFILNAGDAVVERAAPVAIGVIVRMVLAAGLGLIAVIASIVVSITTARALVRQLERLREAAFRLANERLPGVVERLGHGEEVDVAREAPPLEFGDDEIGQVGKAFNVVQETAIRTAVEQAELRRSVREVFLSLARRTQALVHRQLTLLDAMERREHDAEELEDLFRVDHLATRMRRNAENLIVLSGSTPGRAWRRNVPMVDVVRGAVAEVEDYTRVNVLPLGPVSLTGRAVGDVIHLLAELIENGLSFSPPHTTVEVRGQLVANGFAIEIEDRGLGMSGEELVEANDRVGDKSELNLANATRLGLYVVSRLTERHGVKVQLKESAYGGTTAVVLIPIELVTEDGADPTASGGFRAGTGSPSSMVSVASGAPEDAGSGSAAEPVATATVATAEAREDISPDRAETTTEAPRLTPSGLPARTRKRQPAAADPAGTTAAPPPAVASADAAPGADGDAGAQTGSGLPVRRRQASLAPELRSESSTVDTEQDDDPVRPPEQVRRMMSSYQSGTRRGRTDAARLLGGAREAGDGPDTGDEQAD